eukprot:COSAG01_NODE_8026_length_2949_cov_186.367018_2_plen_213_part_00
MKAAAVLVLASLLQGALGSGSGSSSGSSSWGDGFAAPEPSPQGGHTSLPPPPPPVVITMTIPGDVAAITSNATVKAAFEAAFATDIAVHLGIAASRITVTSIAAGSIVVTYSIAPEANGNQVSTAAVQTTLANPITFTTIKNSAAIPSSITTQYDSPVTATGITATGGSPEPEPEPEPPSGTITLDKSGVESIQITTSLVLAPMIVLTMLHN